MQPATRDLASSSRSSGRLRTAAAAALLAAFVVAVALLALDAARGIRGLDDRREEVLASRPGSAAAAGDAAGAFARFRSELRKGDRFALVFSSGVDRDRVGFLRLVALSYLYPAVAVADPERADAVMAFGGPPAPPVRDAFREIGVVDGTWLGRRHG